MKKYTASKLERVPLLFTESLGRPKPSLSGCPESGEEGFDYHPQLTNYSNCTVLYISNYRLRFCQLELRPEVPYDARTLSSILHTRPMVGPHLLIKLAGMIGEDPSPPVALAVDGTSTRWKHHNGYLRSTWSKE